MADQQRRQHERDFRQNPTSENAKKYMTSLARTGCDGNMDGMGVDYADWLLFLQGHWTLTPPTKIGSYIIASRAGEVSLPRVLLFNDPETGELRAMRFTRHARGRDASDVWGGYWWSEPVPELPVVPVIEFDTETSGNSPW